MDLLCRDYSTGSDDEDGNLPGPKPVVHVQPSTKRFKSESSSSFTRQEPEYVPNPARILPAEAPIPGRYISKRERAALASSSPCQADPNAKSMCMPPPVMGSLSCSDLPSHMLSRLRHQTKGYARSGSVAERSVLFLTGHTKSVSAVHWSTSHAHLLASAGMDHTVSIWNVWSRGEKRARILKCHSAAVKDVKWSPQGLFVLSCGYDCSSRLVDVEKSVEAQVFKEDQVVGVIKYHPENFNLFLSGGSKGLVKLWDIRSGKAVHEYRPSLGPILDVEFTGNAKQLISSSDVSRSNVSEKAIVVWDISRKVPLSNQVYTEAYTCPCIRHHPYEPYFVAQSNGNYIAIFSSKPPFKLDKYKRYEGHGVFGFPVKCNFSRDGNIIASGSSDGYVYLYESKSSKFIEKIKAFEQACIDVAFHPVMPNVIALCSWSGEVMVLDGVH